MHEKDPRSLPQKTQTALAQLRNANAKPLAYDFKFRPTDALRIDDDGHIGAIRAFGFKNDSRLQAEKVAHREARHRQIHAEKARKPLSLVPSFFGNEYGNFFRQCKRGGHGSAL